MVKASSREVKAGSSTGRSPDVIDHRKSSVAGWPGRMDDGTGVGSGRHAGPEDPTSA